jgi:hypothetical protein
MLIFLLWSPCLTLLSLSSKRISTCWWVNLDITHFKDAEMKYEGGKSGALEMMMAIKGLCSAKQVAKTSTPVFQYAKVHILHIIME